MDRGAVFAQWRGCLPGALSRSQEPRDREQPTTTLIHRCNGLSARGWIRVVASHGTPREWCFEQRRATVLWHERRARARMRVALTDRHSDFLVGRSNLPLVASCLARALARKRLNTNAFVASQWPSATWSWVGLRVKPSTGLHRRCHRLHSLPSFFVWHRFFSLPYTYTTRNMQHEPS